MPTLDKRVDAYIAKAAEFAQPILGQLRANVHEACPEVEETIKWGFPHFMYKGILCSMAAFKHHCAFGFWKGRVIVRGNPELGDAMGQFGRMTSLKDLPPRRAMIGYIKEAMRLNESGVKPASRLKPRPQKKDLVIPAYFTTAVKKNRKAWTTFDAFPYSKQKDYVEWVTEAKTEETRERRLKTSVEWLAEGKARNWKYEKC